MGAGKTAVGRVVAHRLGRLFVDLDETIEQRLGLSVREIFETRGECAFRDAETEELQRITSHQGLVVATGGGAFSNLDNRRLIGESGGVSVFLDLPWTVIRRRLAGGQKRRPKWVDEDHAFALFETRLPDYLLASTRLELEGEETPEEVASLIESALRETVCVS